MNAKVMIVDDDAHIRLAVSELLKHEGLDVVTADGAASCMKVLNGADTFSGVILMDVMMPQMDGWDTIRMIVDTGKYKDVIIIMLTAKDIPDQKMEGLQTYVTDYVTKPFEPDELISIVNDNLAYLDR